MELASEAWKDDYKDCEAVGIWTKYRFYTTLQVKTAKAFFRAMKYTVYLNHTR